MGNFLRLQLCVALRPTSNSQSTEYSENFQYQKLIENRRANKLRFFPSSENRNLLPLEVISHVSLVSRAKIVCQSRIESFYWIESETEWKSSGNHDRAGSPSNNPGIHGFPCDAFVRDIKFQLILNIERQREEEREHICCRSGVSRRFSFVARATSKVSSGV